jgi:hypothetical protein
MLAHLPPPRVLLPHLKFSLILLGDRPAIIGGNGGQGPAEMPGAG